MHEAISQAMRKLLRRESTLHAIDGNTENIEIKNHPPPWRRHWTRSGRRSRARAGFHCQQI